MRYLKQSKSWKQSRLMVARKGLRRAGDEAFLFNGCRVSEEKILKIGCPTM